MMPPVISALFACMSTLYRSRASLLLEHLALRHQLMVYQWPVPRPHLRVTDRLFWAWLSHLWSVWQHALPFVQPHTVITRQQQRFREYWAARESAGKPQSPCDCPGGLRAHPDDVAGESHLGFASDRRGTA